MADVYPGWEDFAKLIQKQLERATNKADSIGDKLAERAKKIPAGHRCDCGIVTKDAIVDALKNRQGKNYDWSNWAGKFEGAWFTDDTKENKDAQEWKPPEDCSPAENDAIQGVPAGKKCKKQHVIWTNPDGSRKREGWNVSSADTDYVWGWDPKEGPDEHGKNGTHVGFPLKHETGKCWCIVWLTPENRYLECITPDRKCKMSVDKWGHGKWTLAP